MKALFIPHFAKERIAVTTVILSTLMFWIYPEISLAATAQSAGQNTALVFEIKNSEKLLATSQNQNSLSYNQIIENDPLCSKLKAYLEKHDSPLEIYACEIPNNPQWQRALAISWVESNFGRRCVNNNCSGIGVAPGHPSWRKYATKLEWFEDMSRLLETDRYKYKYTTFEKMRGIYVYPGSNSWVYGAKTKYAELMALTAQAQEEKLALSNSHRLTNSLHTFPDLAFN